MRIWLIKKLYATLSPSEKYECQKYVKCPTVDAIWADSCEKLDKLFAARDKRFPVPTDAQSK